MAFNLASIQKVKNTKAPIMVVHGGPGVGKTTLASEFPAPVFLQTERGEGMLTLDAFPMIESLADVHQAIESLANEEHAFQTLVIDSLDHLEPLIWADVCKRERVESLEKIGFGKGFAFALDDWRKLFDGLEYLRDKKGMTIVLIAHSKKVRVEDPGLESYDQTILKLHKNAAPLVVEKADLVLYAKHDIRIKKEEQGFGSTRTRGISTGRRILQTSETPAAVAKNRYNLPLEIELSYSALMAAFNAPKTDEN